MSIFSSVIENVAPGLMVEAFFGNVERGGLKVAISVLADCKMHEIGKVAVLRRTTASCILFDCSFDAGDHLSL